MGGATITDSIKRHAEMLYVSGQRNVAEISKILGVDRKRLYPWIRKQEWYNMKAKSRFEKQMEHMDATFSSERFDAHRRADAPYNVVFPFQVPSLNEFIAVINHNKHTGNKFKRGVEDRMIPFIRDAFPGGFRAFPYKVQVHIAFYEAGERRDWDNIISSQKFIFDALQAAGIIERDDQAHLLPPTYSFGRDTLPHTVVSIYEHPDQPLPVKRAPKKQKSKDTWRDMYGEDEIRAAYRLSKDKKAQYRIFRDFGVTKDELDRILGL